MAQPTDVPSWFGDSSFVSNNPSKARYLKSRWTLPTSTQEERLSARTFKTPGTSHPCTVCGQYAFERPKVCFWCRRGIPA